MRFSLAGMFLALGLVKATNWQVLVGSGSNYTDDSSYQPPWVFNKFYPNSLTITQGDYVQFRWNSQMEQQVVYSNNVTMPLMNSDGSYSEVYSNYPTNSSDTMLATIDSVNTTISSGLRAYYNSDYWVQFNVPGTFMYYCLIHLPYMIGHITVLSTNSTGSTGISGSTVTAGGSMSGTNDTAALNNTLSLIQVYQNAQMEIAQDIALTNNIFTSNGLDVPISNATTGANGTTNYNVWAGWGTNLTNGGYSSSPRFYPAGLVINVGDSVTWNVSMDFMDAHIVSFNGTGFMSYFPDSDMMLSSGAMGANPIYAMRNDNASITANYTFLNSGYLSVMPIIPGAAANQTWTVTFNQTGLYRYVCALHAEAGMVGEIMVVDPAWANSTSVAGQSGPDTFGLTSVRETGLMSATKPRGKFQRLRSVFGRPEL